jgi:hypothetical protein
LMGPARSSRHARGHRTLEDRAAFRSVISRLRRVNRSFLWSLICGPADDCWPRARPVTFREDDEVGRPHARPRQTADSAHSRNLGCAQLRRRPILQRAPAQGDQRLRVRKGLRPRAGRRPAHRLRVGRASVSHRHAPRRPPNPEPPKLGNSGKTAPLRSRPARGVIARPGISRS